MNRTEALGGIERAVMSQKTSIIGCCRAFKLVALIVVAPVAGCVGSVAPSSDVPMHSAGPMLLPDDLVANSKRGTPVEIGSASAPREEIVGTFDSGPSLGYERLELAENGNYVYEAYNCFGGGPVSSGRWSISNGRVVLEPKEKEFPYGLSSSMTVVLIEGRLGIGSPDNPLIRQCGYCEGLILVKTGQSVSSR